MCILCVVQKWSRRVATMLPWLVIPLIGLWALSQLFPPGFRFEVTSPRLACVLVLLVTLFWYEILMPQLSSWRARRSARLIERKRFEAIEMQKLRKMATRRCRNCLTPYREQNPGSGRFMCSYCGHISKRPVLDIPGSAGLGISNSGIIGDLVGKGGKIWNGKAWSENGWISGHDWLENASFSTGNFTGKSNFWGKNGRGFFSGDDRCLAEKSYSGVVVFVWRLLTSFFLSIRWLWRKIFRVTSMDGASSDAEKKGMMSKKGENGVDFHESKGEKARRKAEERKQARLERELLEEEERKQREEVARLVEERRRLRDEKMEAEKDRVKGSALDKEKDRKREGERKRQERKKEKDKGSSKSNSDCEELERRIGKDKRSEIERRDLQKTAMAHNSDNGHVIKAATANNFSRGTGTRYLDRVKGSFLSTSKALNGASFFGRAAHTSASAVSKANKPIGSVDHIQVSTNWRDVHSTEHVPGKLNSNGDDKISETSFHRPVGSEMQARATPKKSWQQLFTRSPVSPPPFSNANGISSSNQKPQAEARSLHSPSQASPTHPLQDPIHFRQSVPFPLSPYSSGLTSNSLVSSSSVGPICPPVGKPPHEYIPEELEIFEDPCYIPDPVSLLGPVSESLDNFPLDLGNGFVKDMEPERPYALKNVSASAEVNKPSPIESPMSRLRVVEERNANPSPFCNTSPSNESSDTHELGTWQMWGTTPLGQDGLGFVGDPASWLLPLGQNISNNKEDISHFSSRKPITSQFATENVLLGAPSPQRVHLGNSQNGGTFGHLGPGAKDNDPWLQRNAFPLLSGDGENHFPLLIPLEENSQNELTYGNSSRPAISHPFEQSPANCWSKKDWAVHGSGDSDGNSVPARPPMWGLFSTPDVQSVWSFN